MARCGNGYSIDKDKKRYLELLDGRLLLVTNTSETAAQVVQRYKSLADIERGFRVLKSLDHDAANHASERKTLLVNLAAGAADQASQAK